jgi:hypothetical protein
VRACVLLVPTDGEVFAVSEYSFWWAGILLLLALLWDHGLPWLRAGYIVLGGLSSPLIGPAAVLLAGARPRADRPIDRNRGARDRARRRADDHGLLQHRQFREVALELHTAEVAERKAGRLLLYRLRPLAEYRYSRVGYVILATLAVMAFLRLDRLDRHFMLLVLVWAAICAMMIVRAPIGKIHPFLSGPRYFFYPFILMSWAGLWIAAVSGPVVKWFSVSPT